MPLIEALSLEQPMAEEHFLARELGVRWITASEDEVAHSLRSKAATLLIVSDPGLYEVVLANAPTKSVVLLQISDEAYTTDRVVQATLPAIRTVFRHYASRVALASQRMRSLAGFIGDARTSSVPMRSAKPLYESGVAIRRRMADWQNVSVPVHSLPLGYTNVFAMAHEDSLRSPIQRQATICFRGNRGLAPRILGLEAAAQLPGASIHLVDRAWSGSGGDSFDARDYIAQLQSSRFALVPPGFVNAESFRYYEAILCGALPVEIRVPITHQGLIPFRSDATVHAWSWRAAMRAVRNMSEDERTRRLTAAQLHLDQQFANARESLGRAVGE